MTAVTSYLRNDESTNEKTSTNCDFVTEWINSNLNVDRRRVLKCELLHKCKTPKWLLSLTRSIPNWNLIEFECSNVNSWTNVELQSDFCHLLEWFQTETLIDSSAQMWTPSPMFCSEVTSVTHSIDSKLQVDRCRVLKCTNVKLQSDFCHLLDWFQTASWSMSSA